MKKIENFKPQVIGFSVRSGEYLFCLNLAKIIKKDYKDIIIVFGGVHPTIEPEEVISTDPVDIVCIGEGEYSLNELLDRIDSGKDFSNIGGLWFKKENKIIRNSIRNYIEDIDLLPFQDREVYDYKKYLKSNNGKIDMMASRGCPFNCAYCINEFTKKNFKGKSVRFRSPQKVVEEIKKLKEKYDIKSIHFHDDVFTANKAWLKEFSEIYAKQVKLPFTCNLRVETLDDEICSYLKKSDCKRVNIGVESGNEKLRETVLKRYMSNKQIIKAFELVKKYGIKTYSFNMVGIPYETEKEYWDTIKLNRILKPDYLQASIFQPYPGTQLTKICLERGFLKEIKIPEGHSYFSILDYPEITRKQIQKRKRYFRYRVLKSYNMKKALIALFFDTFFLTYWKIRPKMPIWSKTLAYKIKNKIRS